MDNIAKRIRDVFNNKHLSATSFAEMAGMQAVTVNRQLNGTSPMSFTLIDSVLNQFPDISAEWLLRGVGSMFRDEEPTQKSAGFIDVFLKGICTSDTTELDAAQEAIASVRKLRNIQSTKNQN